MRIMSIDPGSSSTGVTIFEIVNGVPEVISADTIQADKLVRYYQYIEELHGARFARIHAIGETMTSLLDTYQPNVVITESPFMGKFANAFASLTEVLAEIRGRVFAYNPSIPLLTIDPSSVKESLGTKGNSNDKDLVKNAVLARSLSYRTYLNISVFDEHTFDSIAVGLYYIDNYLT